MDDFGVAGGEWVLGEEVIFWIIGPIWDFVCCKISRWR
jgi:hypothetical protein